MLSKEKGDIALGKAISYFIATGHEVCLPIGDKRDYDPVVEKQGHLARVQVKYGGLYRSATTCRVALRVMGGNRSFHFAKKYTANAFEYLFTYTAKGQAYILPWRGDIIGKSSINIEAYKYQKFRVHLQG